MFKRGQPVQYREHYHGPGQVKVNGAGGIGLLRHAGHGGGHVEPAEYADRLAVGGRDQIAADQNAEQNGVQRQMRENALTRVRRP